jgi:hypothetical protein
MTNILILLCFKHYKLNNIKNKWVPYLKKMKNFNPAEFFFLISKNRKILINDFEENKIWYKKVLYTKICRGLLFCIHNIVDSNLHFFGVFLSNPAEKNSFIFYILNIDQNKYDNRDCY